MINKGDIHAQILLHYIQMAFCRSVPVPEPNNVGRNTHTNQGVWAVPCYAGRHCHLLVWEL